MNAREALKCPLPYLKGQKGTERFVRMTLLAYRKRFLSVKGAEHIAPENDAFILALNHNQRPEAILIPAILMYLREGKHVHFMADWNFALVPGVAALYKAGGVVLVNRKPAKPDFLNLFRPLYTEEASPMVAAEEMLKQGKSVGIYPEGTVNRDPHHLLKGFSGAARLSLKTRCKVVPAGIKFPNHKGDGPIQDNEPMSIEFGAPMEPPAPSDQPSFKEAKNWHEQIMREISTLSDKSWNPSAGRKKTCR